MAIDDQGSSGHGRRRFLGRARAEASKRLVSSGGKRRVVPWAYCVHDVADPTPPGRGPPSLLVRRSPNPRGARKLSGTGSIPSASDAETGNTAGVEPCVTGTAIRVWYGAMFPSSGVGRAIARAACRAQRAASFSPAWLLVHRKELFSIDNFLVGHVLAKPIFGESAVLEPAFGKHGHLHARDGSDPAGHNVAF